MKSTFRLLSVLFAVTTLSISLTVSAVEDCRIVVGGAPKPLEIGDPFQYVNQTALGFKPDLVFESSRHGNGDVYHKITAQSPDGKTLGRIEFRFAEAGKKLFITYVTRNDSVRGTGLPKAMLAKILKYNPDVRFIDANLMQINALVVDRFLRTGMPLEQAVLKAPTAQMAYELGFTKVGELKDYSFFTEGSYHLMLGR